MSVASIRARLNRAIDQLPMEPESLTIDQIDARLISRGFDPQSLKDHIKQNPNLSRTESMMFAIDEVVSQILYPGQSHSPCTPERANHVLACVAERHQQRYFRTNDGKLVKRRTKKQCAR